MKWKKVGCIVLSLAVIAGIVAISGCAQYPSGTITPTPTTHATPEKWTKTLGGGDTEMGYSAQQTSDSGYIVVGYTESATGKKDVYLIKIDAYGDEVWEKTFGEKDYYDVGDSVQQTSDGGYIVAGRKSWYGAGSADVYLIKVDVNGSKVWEKTFGGREYHAKNSVQQTSDGGYIIAGERSSDVCLIKTDANGSKVWEKTFGEPSPDKVNSVQQTSDDGYIIAGATTPFAGGAGAHDVYLIKTDVNGSEVWEKTFGGGNADEGASVQQTSDGGYVIAGMTYSYGSGKSDVYLIKTDSNGNKVWEKTFGGSGEDVGTSIRQTSDGGYIVVGWTDSYGAGKDDVYLIKTDTSGNKVWEKTFGGSGEDDWGRSVQQTSDGGYIIAGVTFSYGSSGDIYLIKTDANGNI